MDWMEYKQLETISYNFYDTIDFTKFFPDPHITNRIDIDELMTVISDYYEHWEPQSMPKEFEGYFFNCIDRYEFAVYLKKRYNMSMTEEVIEKYYLFQ